MTRFPNDKAPPDYNQDVFTRAFEDIYQGLDGVDSKLGSQIAELNNKLSTTSDSVNTVQTKLQQDNMSQAGPMPVPENLKIYKVPLVPLVVMWCDPIEIIKYPYIGGIQFFASPEENFVPLDLSGYVTYTGNCTAGSAGPVMADTSNVTVSNVPLLGTKYDGIPFWDDMDLVANSVVVTNTTDSSSGTVTAWNKNTPWQFTCALAGGNDNTWQNGDGYTFQLNRNKNLIGQGPLPFATQLFPLLQVSNIRWNAFSVYGKARFYGRGLPKQRRYGTFSCASNTAFADQELSEPTNVSAEPFVESNYIIVTWDSGHDAGDAFGGYRLYRTTANTTALLTDDTYLLSDNLNTNEYVDYGYDVVHYPNGPEPDVTYYYWVRAADTGGFQSDFDVADDAILAVPNAPIFISGVEESSTGYGNLKNWIVQWKATGGALGYNVKYKLNGEDYGLATYVPHTDAYGLDGGEDIQQFTFMGLESGQTYVFAIQSVNNLTVAGLQSVFTEQSYAIANSGPPLPPF